MVLDWLIKLIPTGFALINALMKVLGIVIRALQLIMKKKEDKYEDEQKDGEQIPSDMSVAHA